MTDTLRLEGNGQNIDLYPWLTAKARGQEALAGILGFGLPGVTNQWFEGAGGSTWRGSRVERRAITLPMKVYAPDRTALTQELSSLSTALDPFQPVPAGRRGPGRLYFGMADDKEWFTDVVRAGGGDWPRKVDSDDRTYFKTSLALESADPFWTRNEPEKFEIKVTPSGNPLLPRIARLRVGSEAVSGTRTVENIGDTWAWPVITVRGPATAVELIGPNGEELIWTGVLTSAQTMTIDMRNNTVERNDGTNLYGGLAAAPRFWYIAPGSSEVTVIVDGMTNDSLLVAQWSPRRWAVV